MRNNVAGLSTEPADDQVVEIAALDQELRPLGSILSLAQVPMGGQIFLACARWSLPIFAVRSPLAPFLDREDGPGPDVVGVSRQISWLPPHLLRPQLPFLLKLMPLQDIGKKVQVEACLFAQHRHTSAIFRASGLQANGNQMFRQ